MNFLYKTDSYKVTHWKQYPPGSEHVYSYLESRVGTDSLFYGLQYNLKKHFEGVVVNQDMIEEADIFFKKHFGKDLFNRDGWERIVNEHDGKLPVIIHAVPEGSIVPVSTPLMTIENTDPALPWLTNYLETILVQVWYPITVATYSNNIKKTILQHLNLSGTPEDIHFKLHDFGVRGSTSMESAGIGGSAHLLNFLGTDNLPAIDMIDKYYGCDMAGFSIPASEHSTISSWLKENEVEAFRNMLTQYPDGIIACVSDSFDIFKACENLWGTSLRDEVLNRNGTLVVRPDSGDPVQVVLKCLKILGERFGYETNEKGYRVLNPHVRLIQGDGIDHYTINEILKTMESRKWSADNIAFGSGGALLQKMNRDTFSFAFKCSNITVNGLDRPVFKDPITQISKVSKSGRFKGLVEVFKNGEITKEYNLFEIRKNARFNVFSL